MKVTRHCALLQDEDVSFWIWMDARSAIQADRGLKADLNFETVNK